MIESTDAYKLAITGAVRKMYIKAVVDLIDPDITYGTATHQSVSAYSHDTELHDKIFDSPPKYATLEAGRWKLDGTWPILPTDPAEFTNNVGYIGGDVCGADGNFSTAQYVEMAFANVSVLQACSIYFSDNDYDGVPENFMVEVKQGGTAYYTKTVTGNTATSISLKGFTVNNPDAIRLTVTKWSKPYRRMRVIEIVPGIYEHWGESIIAELTVNQQINTACTALPYGTATLKMDNLDRRFEPRAKAGLFQSIEERQGIPLSIGVKLANGTVEYKQLGVFYQYSGGWKTGDNGLTMQWDLVDIIGLLSSRAFVCPETLPTTLSGWAEALVAQLGTNFAERYSVDTNYASTACTVYSADNLKGKTCGDVLRYICMATGTFPRADAETGYLCIEPTWSQGNYLDLDNMSKYPVMKANDDIAYIQLKIYTSATSTTTYNISGNSTAASKTVSIDNPFIHTQAAALVAARNVLETYGGNQIEVSERGDPTNEMGDIASVQLDKSQATSARRISQQFAFGGGVMKDLTANLLQANGIKMYKNCVILTSNQTWTAPAGVTALHVILVGGGAGGGHGADGTFASAGYCGTDGLGGKVWASDISINERQQFAVIIGAGGAAGTGLNNGSAGTDTTFGDYSSASGNRYGGYTDIGNGNVYARDAVQLPLDNSGDGGLGGNGGTQGSLHVATTKYGGDWTDNNGHWYVSYDAINQTITYSHNTPTALPQVGNIIDGGIISDIAADGTITTKTDVIDCRPGAGEPGAAGASGCVVIWYDKEAA